MTTEDIRKALLKLPRKSRAAVNGDSGFADINGAFVVRLTRRYWRVHGTPMKLAKAIEVIQ